MRNVIDACKKHSTRLVFFDNVYMYGKVDRWMTEETPARPTGKKGEIRASGAEMLMNEVKKGDLQALIARSADFYGHNANTSVAGMLVFGNLMNSSRFEREFCFKATTHEEGIYETVWYLQRSSAKK